MKSMRSCKGKYWSRWKEVRKYLIVTLALVAEKCCKIEWRVLFKVRADY